MRHIRSFCLVLVLTLAPALNAETTLSSIIGDNMVLQRNAPVVLWGWDNADKTVSVSIGDASATANVAADGGWSVSLPAMKEGGPHTIVIRGSEKIEVKNVLVGEVWLCSGQSNMEWTVSRSLNPQEEIAAGTHPRIRHIKFPHATSDKPINNARTLGWTETTPNTVANYTAVGYYFAREIEKTLDVPVGLIGCNWGGTRIEPWTPPVGFQMVPALKKDFADKLDSFPGKNNKGQVIHQTPLAIYNAMVHPILKYRFKGSLWYQGESNNGEGMLYHEKMKALILGWREVFGHPEMPFHFVQLAPYRYNRPEALPGIWQAQLATLAVKHTGMAVTVDIGNVNDIHPKNKQEVGRRLSLWALANDYDKGIPVYTGPLFETVQRGTANNLLVSFQQGSAGGLTTRDNESPSHFEVADADGKWHAATAKITDKGQVQLASKNVDAPVAVRYGWNELAEPNLVNGAGLPASPFSGEVK